MIPDNPSISKRLSLPAVQYVLLNPKDYFKIVDEYVSLQKIFVKETLLDKVWLWFDMLISPLITVFQAIFMKKIPDIFSMLSMQKCVKLWKDWIRFKEIQGMLREWIKIVKSIGGPFIGCNDAEYHMFVYADAMQRVYESLLLLITKERTKGTK